LTGRSAVVEVAVEVVVATPVEEVVVVEMVVEGLVLTL
jgi:hypothetical protein